MFRLAKKDADQPGSDFATNDWNVILRSPMTIRPPEKAMLVISFHLSKMSIWSDTAS